MSRAQRALRDSASAAQPGGGSASASASQPGVDLAEKLLQQVRQLGYYPRKTRSLGMECQLAEQLRTTQKAGLFDAAQLAEHEGFRKCVAVQRAAQAAAKASAKAAANKTKAQTLVDQVLNLGYLPREYRKEETKLARQGL